MCILMSDGWGWAEVKGFVNLCVYTIPSSMSWRIFFCVGLVEKVCDIYSVQMPNN